MFGGASCGEDRLAHEYDAFPLSLLLEGSRPWMDQAIPYLGKPTHFGQMSPREGANSRPRQASLVMSMAISRRISAAFTSFQLAPVINITFPAIPVSMASSLWV